MVPLNPRYEEILTILQEECAEVIQEVSKVRRFGIDEQHKDGMTHREKLTAEVGDVICMIDLLVRSGIVNDPKLAGARAAKIEKLKKYSNIFQDFPGLDTDTWYEQDGSKVE